VNRSIFGRVFAILLLFYALAFAGFFIASIIGLRAGTVLPSFRVGYAARRALITFTDYLIPVHVSAVMVAFSLGAPLGARRAAGGAALPFHRLVSPALVLFIVLGVGYTFLYETAVPLLARRAGDLEQLSANARLFKASMESHHKAGEFPQALEAAELYLGIDPQDKGVKAELLTIQAEAARGRIAAFKTPAAEPDKGAAPLIDRARKAYDTGDYMLAHDLASRAHALEPDRGDALRIAALAWTMAVEKTVPRKKEDEASAKQFSSKKEAYLRLMAGDPFVAYYSFVGLAARYPEDPDVKEYLAQSRVKVSSETFFLDEIDRVRSLPATRSILFVNSRAQGRTEVFSFDSMVESREGTYFLGVEAIRYRRDGGIDYHLTAPSGKLKTEPLPGSEGTFLMSILLHGVDRTNAGVETLPRYAAGARSGVERTMLTLGPEPAAMRALTVDQDRTRVGLPELWNLRRALTGYGVPRKQLEAAIVMKAVMPFLFLTLSFLAISLGWAYRARYLGRPPFRAVILVPLIPLAASLASLLWVHGHRVLLGFVVLAAGLSPALIAVAVLELVVLVVSVILLAGQSVA
jgi:hypothetical protein